MQIEIEFDTADEEMSIYVDVGEARWLTHDEHLQVIVGKRITNARFSRFKNRILLILED